MTINLENYYNRFDPNQANYDRLLFRASLGLQSAELNEIQAISDYNLTRIANQIMTDGSVVSGCMVIINQDTGETTCAGGEIYLRGRIRDVAEKKITIATIGEVQIGIWLSETIVTELQEPSLRDPAEGSKNYDERGAGRLLVNAEWGTDQDGLAGNFYRVYDVLNGVLKLKSAPPDMTGFNNALARYDRDNNGGNYIIHGLKTRYIETKDGFLHYSISEGKAHVHGHEIELPTSLRLKFDYDPDVQSIVSEPHQCTAKNGGRQRINVHRTPIHDIQKVDITVQKTAQIVHGSYQGVADELPDTSVIEIVKVVQGRTTYRAGTDYTFTAGKIDWQPSGNEPAAGSSYHVTYKYIAQATPIDPDETGFSIENAVEGTLILVSYQCRLPRIDTLVMAKDGSIHKIRSLPHTHSPRASSIPVGTLELAQLHYGWFDANPVYIKHTAIAAVSMARLQDMEADIITLYDLVAEQRLKNDAIAAAPAATHGVFVDAFLNDSQRDLGQEQTAAIKDGLLMLPIATTAHSLDVISDTAVTLPFELEVVIEQTAQTGSMKINPYAAFDPIPAEVKLIPNVDTWTKTITLKGAEETRTIGSGLAQRVVRQEEVRRVIDVQQEQFLRPITIYFDIKGFLPTEQLQQVNFDGILIEVKAP